MDRIALRELRNNVSQIVRRARAGERLIITVDGIPAAEIGPLRPVDRSTTLEELIATASIIGRPMASPVIMIELIFSASTSCHHSGGTAASVVTPCRSQALVTSRARR